MAHRLLPIVVAFVAATAVWNLDPSGSQQAFGGEAGRTAGDLFYNYYVPPGACGGVGAQLYVSPRPTPPLVGHTYVTYQPLMPHEFMYSHGRTYLRRNPGSGWTRTVVSWNNTLFDFGSLGRSPMAVAPQSLVHKWTSH
ncbi:MAG TPA: hypothetical protein VMY42_22740 [Thermoguttaceae bacterium]|nr:hypothetical protein [Thermoguttaceae bacterium]